MECPICGHDLLSDAVYCPRCSTPVAGAEECGDYAYEAFISYRHRDLDRTVAMRIQRAVEGFRIPKQLQEAAGKQRLGKCFRDEDELPTSASLSDQILDALQHSRYLVVICSKATRESIWVQREVETFASYHGRDRILIALAEGEPDESFPELLLSTVRIGSDGAPEEVPAEPIAADFRDLSRGKFDVEKLRIIATLVGCSFDDLRQRARLRRNKIVAAITSGIAVVSSAFGGFATYQQKQIEQSYRQVQIEQSEFLAVESADLLASGDRYQATQVALAALPMSSVSPDRPYVPVAQLALEQSLGIYPGFTVWNSLYSQTSLADRLFEKYVAFNGSGLEASIAADTLFEIRDTDSGDIICRFDAGEALGLDPESSRTDTTFAFSGQRLIVIFGGYPSSDDAVACFDAQDGALLWKREAKNISYRDESLAISPDGRYVAVIAKPDSGMRTTPVYLIDVADGSEKASFELPGYLELGIESPDSYESTLAFSSDGEKLLVGQWGTLFCVDIDSKTYEQRALRYGCVSRIDVVDDLIAAVSEDTEGYYSGANSACIETFDSSLDPLWSYEGVAEVGTDTSGAAYQREIGVFGAWSFYGGDDRQLVTLFGNDLLLLDAQTGQEVFKIESPSSFMDCLVTEARGKQRIFALMGDGSVICRIPLDSNSGNGGTVSDTTLDVGHLAWGDLTLENGRVYCTALVSSPALKRTTWRFADTGDLVESRLLAEDLDTSNLRGFFWSPGCLVVQSRSENSFIDPDTLEFRMTVPYADLDLLDGERWFYIEQCLDNGGNLYVMGPGIGEDAGEYTYVVYRIDGEDGSVSLVALLEDVYDCKQLNMTEEFDGRQLLVSVVSCADGDEHVLLLDPDGGPGESPYVDLPYPDATNAFFVGADRLLVSIDEQQSSWDRCSLIDLSTGEEMECDLAECGQYRWRCSSASLETARFATACSDGSLRMFDTSTGAQLWESHEVPSEVQYLAIVDGGNIFLQDAFGRCMLVSGLTGEVLTATSTTLPPIKVLASRTGTAEALALFTDTRIVFKDGLAVISLDEDSFGPRSILYDAYYVSMGNDLFVYIDDFTNDLCVARMLSLDELIVYGGELTAGHELTDAERHFYQVGGQSPAEMVAGVL